MSVAPRCGQWAKTAAAPSRSCGTYTRDAHQHSIVAEPVSFPLALSHQLSMPISQSGSQTRAMQTAVSAFGGGVWHDSDAQLPLMAEVPGVSGRSTAHPAVALGAVPFVAYEMCREHLGALPLPATDLTFCRA